MGKRFRGLSVGFVFWFVAIVGTAGIGAVYVMGVSWIPLAAVASLLLGGSLYIGDRKGFHRKRSAMHNLAPRHYFSIIETCILLFLLVGNIFVSVYIVLRQIGS